MQGFTDTMPNMESILEGLRAAAAERSFERLENLWIEAVENAAEVSARLGCFLEIVEPLFQDDKGSSRAGPLLELLLGCIGEGTDAAGALRLYGLLVRAQPSKKEYRAVFSERFERLYPLASPERVFYEASGFAAASNPVAALARLEKLLRFREGAHVFHASGWGMGKVISVDPFLRQVRVDLEHKRDHRIAVDAVDSILEPLEPGSFLVLSHEGGEGLRKLRDEDPVRLVNMICDTFGSPTSLKDLKARLVPKVVDAGSWTKWWNRAKGLLRETGLFRISDRPPHTVERLVKAVSYEAELLRDFHRFDWNYARQIARQVSRRTGVEMAGAWEKVRERLSALVDGKDLSTVIEAALILDRGDRLEGDPNLARALGRFSVQDIVNTLSSLSGAEDQRRVVESLPSTRPADWQEIASLLVMGTKDTLRDAAIEILERQAPSRVEAIIQGLIRSPKSSPEAFCFGLEIYLDSTLKPQGADNLKRRPSLAAFGERSPRDLLVLVMDLLDHLQHHAQRRGRVSFKGIVGRIEDILGDHDDRFFVEGARHMSTAERAETYERLVKNESLTPHVKGALLQHILDIDPGLASMKEAKMPWDEDSLFVTKEGLEKKKTEFREIMEVKLPKVFEDIGRAAAFGDLSENAEYTSALEERDHLTKRATSMKEDLDRSKLIPPNHKDDGIVGLGSRIRLQNGRTGEETVYSILGPWDGSPEDGVLNYLSPLARLFFGRKAGDEVEAQLPGGNEKFKILEVGSHFTAPRAP